MASLACALFAETGSWLPRVKLHTSSTDALLPLGQLLGVVLVAEPTEGLPSSFRRQTTQWMIQIVAKTRCFSSDHSMTTFGTQCLFPFGRCSVGLCIDSAATPTTSCTLDSAETKAA